MVYLLYMSFFWFVSLDGLIIWILFFFFALMTHLPPQCLKPAHKWGFVFCFSVVQQISWKNQSRWKCCTCERVELLFFFLTAKTRWGIRINICIGKRRFRITHSAPRTIQQAAYWLLFFITHKKRKPPYVCVAYNCTLVSKRTIAAK